MGVYKKKYMLELFTYCPIPFGGLPRLGSSVGLDGSLRSYMWWGGVLGHFVCWDWVSPMLELVAGWSEVPVLQEAFQ